jgi:hypothetical protein
MDEQTRKAVAEAIVAYGSPGHTVAAGPLLDVLTPLARSGDLTAFAEACEAFKMAVPKSARTLEDYAPAKILSEYLCRQPGVDASKAERFRAKDPDWAQRLMGSIWSPVRLNAVAEDMLSELRAL